MSDQQQRTMRPFTQRIDNFLMEFQAVADNYEALQINLHKASIEPLYTLLSDFTRAPLSSPDEISRALAILKEAIPLLELAKTLFEKFSLRAKTFQNAFDHLCAADDLEKRTSVSQLLESGNRERFIKFFGSATLIGICKEHVDERLGMLNDFLNKAKSGNIGCVEWVGLFD